MFSFFRLDAPSAGPDGDRPLAGIACAVLAMALFSAMDALIKVLQADYSTWQIYFFRSWPALLPVWFLIHRSGGLESLRTQHLPLHLLFAGLMIGFLMGFFHALQYLSLSNAYAVAFATPLLIAALSVPLLGERVGRRRWTAVLIGFLGVLVVLRPGGAIGGGGSILLLAVLLNALAMIVLRRLSRSESQAAIVFYFTALSALVAGAAMPAVWVTPPLRDWGLLLAIGLVGGVGQIAITRAFSLAPAVTVSPFQYTQIVWGILLGWLIFADRPDPLVLAGAALVIASGLYLLKHESRSG